MKLLLLHRIAAKILFSAVYTGKVHLRKAELPKFKNNLKKRFVNFAFSLKALTVSCKWK